MKEKLKGSINFRQQNPDTGIPTTREDLQLAVQVLKDISEQFKIIQSQAEELLSTNDRVGYLEKLKEGAKLFIGLSDKITDKLKDINGETKSKIIIYISGIESLAQEALSMQTDFGLTTLLTSKGSKIGDENILDKFIKTIK